MEDTDTTLRTLISSGPTPSEPLTACVVVIHGEGLGKRMDIGERPLIIGRSHDVDLRILHPSVSRQHCEIWYENGRYRVRDLNSTNRTRLNEVAIESAELNDGDHITVGESILKFVSHVSVEARYHEEVHQLATHDALTGFYSRRHYLEIVEREIARAARAGSALALAIIDVDLFKRINDRHGHLAGDAVLRQVAAEVTGAQPEGFIAGRIGGEEFAVLMPDTSQDDALAVAETLRRAVAQSVFIVAGNRENVTISIGLAHLGAIHRDRSSLMRAADSALYQAKEEGRNRVAIADWTGPIELSDLDEDQALP